MNIIITGASSGIGFEFAKFYSRKNNNLLLIARNSKRLTEISNICIKKDANIIKKICDVCDQEKLSKIISDFDNKYPVDLVIANSGISAGTSGEGESYQQLKQIYDTNIYGVVNTIYPLIDSFKKRKSGQIAIMSSMASFRGLPSAPAYSSSKVAVRFLADALRGDLLKYNVAVNIICPGYIKTPMTDVNKFPMPFLMSSEKAVKYIAKNLAKNKPVIIFPKIIYYFLKLLNILPIFISDRIFNSLPKK